MLNVKTYIPWMAWRHITSRKRGGLSFMTIISISGIAIGVAALVVVLSVMGGFENDLRAKMFRGLPNLEVMAKEQAIGFSLHEYPLKKFRTLFPDAVGVEPFTQADVLLKRRAHLAPVTLFGIDPQLGGSLWGFSGGMVSGKITDLSATTDAAEGLPPIILGESLALNLGADVGSEVTILSPQASVHDALGGQALTRTFRITGIFRTKLLRFDSQYAVVSLKEGRTFMAEYDESLQTDEYVTGIAINMRNPDAVEVFTSALKDFPALKALTWKQVNKALLFALKLEKFTMGAILLLIVLVAAFSISGTLMMTVFHRRSQVALLRSLGMGQPDVVWLFLAQGFTIGLIGIVLGMAIGLALCGFIHYSQLVDLPLGVYYQKKMPVKFLPVEYGVICACAWGLSLIAAAYPALTAARHDPGTGLRYR